MREAFSDYEARQQVEEDCEEACRSIEHLLAQLEEMPQASLAKEIFYHGSIATVSTMLIGFRELITAAVSLLGSAAYIKSKDYLFKNDSGLTRVALQKRIGQLQDALLELGKLNFDVTASTCANHKIDLFRNHNFIEVSIRRLVEDFK